MTRSALQGNHSDLMSCTVTILLLTRPCHRHTSQVKATCMLGTVSKDGSSHFAGIKLLMNMNVPAGAQRSLSGCLSLKNSTTR